MEHKQLGMMLIVAAVLVLVFAQLLLKNRLNFHGAIPVSSMDFFPYMLGMAKDLKAWIAAAGLVISAIMWYAAVSRLPLSFAFPFAAMSYPLIFIASVLFLGESFSYIKLLGNTLIVSGVILVGVYGNS